jgi:hypothetical protein
LEFYFNENQYHSKWSLSKFNCSRTTTIHMIKLLSAGLIAFKDYFTNKNIFITIFIMVYVLVLIF